MSGFTNEYHPKRTLLQQGGIEAAFKRVFSASENPEKLREEVKLRPPIISNLLALQDDGSI